jgi:hypothetical protein
MAYVLAVEEPMKRLETGHYIPTNKRKTFWKKLVTEEMLLIHNQVDFSNKKHHFI